MLSTAHRSHYEGTSFDMTVGIAAGPHGSPDRYAVPGSPVPTIDIATGFPLKSDPIRFMGAWERSVVRPLPPPRLSRHPWPAPVQVRLPVATSCLFVAAWL